MPDMSIQKDFIEGTYEIFYTLFNNGDTDGVDLYLLSEDATPNVYGEVPFKTYKSPIRLICKAQSTPTQGEETVEGIKDITVFTVPVKCLNLHDLGTENKDLNLLRKGVMKFHNTFYKIDNIIPTAYVEDVFLFYQFQCTEDVTMEDIKIIESDSDKEGEDMDGDTTK